MFRRPKCEICQLRQTEDKYCAVCETRASNYLPKIEELLKQQNEGCKSAAEVAVEMFNLLFEVVYGR